MSKNIFVYKKGGCYSLDELLITGQIMTSVSRKPTSPEECIKYGIELANISGNEIDGFDGSMSDYDIFEKTVKITIEITD